MKHAYDTPSPEEEELDDLLFRYGGTEDDDSFAGTDAVSTPPSENADRNRGRRRRAKKELKPRSVLYEILDYIVTLAVVAGAVLLINSFVLINARIPSESMEPTIQKGNQIFGSRLTYRFRDPERFDIIIFRYPDDESQFFIKRLIGLPGETVRIENGQVFINDGAKPLDDSYVAEEWGFFDEPMIFEVPEDCYFCMGDNRNHSNDSRYWQNHFVTRDEILGKAVLRYWPVWDMKIFRYIPTEEES